MKSFLKKNTPELVLLTFVMIIAIWVHGVNMFHYPYYENDEGTYMSQAWSIIKHGSLAPYTYWYDHAPAGWILIAAWVKLTGGFFTFGTSVDSGRLLMLFLHGASALFLYFIAKRMTKSMWAGALAVLIFSISPLGLYYQRRVLLDNIMVFWLLASLALLLKEKRTLFEIIASGICFGIAVLSKETAVIFIPATLYTLVTSTKPIHKRFGIMGWFFASGAVVSLYIVYALLKREFFPPGIVTTYQHVSMIGSYIYQFSRGSGLPFWNEKSEYYLALTTWLTKDWYTVYLAIMSSVTVVLLAIRYPKFRLLALLSAMMWLFFIRGKLIIDFYVIPLIPLTALNIAVLAHTIIDWATQKKRAVYALAFIVLMYGLYNLHAGSIRFYQTRDETAPQRDAIAWIKQNLPSETTIAIDGFAYVDLHEARFAGDRVYPNADWVWKIELDPEIRDAKLKSNWYNVQYVMLSHEVLKQVRGGQFPIVKMALDNSTPVAEWKRGSTSFFDLEKYISTNGDWMSIYKLKDKDHIALANSWRYYKQHFIRDYGQVIDPAQDNATTSEGQAYAMLRAVYADDKAAFDGIWQWTQDHMQHRTQDKLLSWSWKKVNGNYQLTDSETAADADVDAALALTLAGIKWENPLYVKQAEAMVQDIWRQEVVRVNGRYLLVSSTSPVRGDGYLVNPSYFSPAHYRVFAQIDTEHPWTELSADTYKVLDQISIHTSSGLPPNWIIVGRDGSMQDASAYTGADSNRFGYDAFRLLWRTGLDASWFHTQEAIKYMQSMEAFFKQNWEAHTLSSIYNANGTPAVLYSNISTETAPLMVFSVTDKSLARKFYAEQFEKRYNQAGYWEHKDNYFDQNWAWLGTALYTKKFTLLKR